MTATERAAQIWSVLAWAGTNRQILNYGDVSQLVGVPRQGLGPLLEPIQSYCLVHKLPPLSILVVSKATGLPGSGFIAAADIPRHQAKVFRHDWLAMGCPSPDDFAQAVKKLPSRSLTRRRPHGRPR